MADNRQMGPGTVIAGRFRLSALRARGGMGAVYRALDLQSGTAVAVKIAHHATDLDHRHAVRMMREARALSDRLAALSHQGIVRYIDHGVTAAGQPFLVMEWLEGCDLSQRVRRAALKESETIRIGIQVCRALATAHGCGVIHRDIKPGNVFLVDDDLGRVKLIDFGLARMDTTMTTLTHPGMLMGTPSFVAPEQAAGDLLTDARADLYSLGAVLFTCLTQQPPFIGQNYMAVLAKLALETAPRVRELRADVSPALESLIARLLAKEADQRPNSAAQVAAALTDIETGAGAPKPVAVVQTSSISSSELQFFSVLLVSRAATADDPARQAALLARIEGRDAVVAPLANGAVVAMFAAEQDPTQMAANAARCALDVRQAGALVPVIVATGRGQFEERMPVGDVIERAVGLLLGTGPGANSGIQDDDTVPLAEAHGVVVDDVTAGLLDSRFQLQPIAPDAYVLAGERAHPGVGRSRVGNAGRYVGRERELAALVALWRECEAESAPRAALVTGPPGAGKSRLAHELVERLRADGQSAARPLAIWAAYGQSLGAGTSLGLLAQVIGQALDLNPAAPEAQRRAHIQRRVRARMAAGDSNADDDRDGNGDGGKDCDRIAVFLGEIVGTRFSHEGRVQLQEARRDPQLMHDQMRQAWQDWLAAEAAKSPVLILLDDMQWGDVATVRFIDGALRTPGDCPFMVLALARPEIDQTFPNLWISRSIEHLPLRPLARRASLALARHVRAELSDTILERLVERSGGNPFFLEELLHHTASDRLAPPPESVLAVVSARLRKLPWDQRRVLRAASVFGRRFWLGGVRALLGTAGGAVAEILKQLGECDLVTGQRRGRLPGEMEYAFVHELVRDAAYAMLPDADRETAHRSAGIWLERVGEDDPLVLAEHYQRGRAPARAVPWFVRAAERALEANDIRAVNERVERGIACGASGAVRGQLRLMQAEAHNWSNEHEAARVCAREAMTHLPPGGDAWAHAAHQHSWAACALSDVEAVTAIATEVIERAGQKSNDAYLTTLARCATHLCALQCNSVVQTIVHWIDRQPQASSPSVAATVCHMRAQLAQEASHVAEAAYWLVQALEFWRVAGNEREAFLDQGNLGIVLRIIGEYDESIKVTRDCLDRIPGGAFTHLVGNFVASMALALAHTDALQDAKMLIKNALSLKQLLQFQAKSHVYAAQIALLDADPNAALSESDHALAILPTDVNLDIHALALAVRAQALLALDQPQEALSTARKGIDITAAIGAIGEGGVLLRLVHAQALHAAGNTDQAIAAIEAARSHLLDRAHNIQDPARRSRFLTRVPENRRTLELWRIWTQS